MLKKCKFVKLLCVLFFLSLWTAGGEVEAEARPRTDVDTYLEKGYDFSKLHSIYLWPHTIETLPESVSLSMPLRIEDWQEDALKSKQVRNAFVLKPTKSVWQSVQLIYGPFDFEEPFESEESEKFFYAHLDGACSAVLKTTVSLSTERQWQPPRTETYTTTERIHSRERRKKSNGQYETVDVYTEIPVVKERVIPGYWYTTAQSKCHLELYDTKKLDARYIAAVRVTGRDESNDGEKSIVERLMKKTVEDAVAAIFYKKK
ncbi:MAG: hypothetical protein LBQ42_00920 [Synergistaceae bacterium]|jgi:hypothetical protein|nr:hypothetical protein [Synergistaceae bacterium]